MNRKWHFNASNNQVSIRAIRDICLQNFDQWTVFINNVAELSNKNIISDDQVEIAIKHLKEQKKYLGDVGISLFGQPTQNAYWIKEWLIPHEELHRQDYQKVVNEVSKMFSKRFKKYVETKLR